MYYVASLRAERSTQDAWVAACGAGAAGRGARAAGRLQPGRLAARAARLLTHQCHLRAAHRLHRAGEYDQILLPYIRLLTIKYQ